jgi:CxxC-x17-CxxC domain-containing protein
MSYADKTLTCRDCGSSFVFTAGEQEFYAQKGFMNEPTRCPSCRQARKSSGGASSGSRSSFGAGGGGGGSFGERSGGSRGSYAGGNGGRDRVQHETTCAACGKVTTVPFVPRGDRPVYCSDCFAERRASSSRW